jgi:hypothetical protein
LFEVIAVKYTAYEEVATPISATVKVSNIVDDKDWRQAAEKIEGFYGSQVTPAVGPEVT